MTAQPAAAAVTVTVAAPTRGGPVSSYTVTVDPGGTTTTLAVPGTVTIPVPGCAQVTATATATGPGGTSPASAPAQALGCLPPGPVQNMARENVAVLPIPFPGEPPGGIRLTWDPPTDTGGGTVDYLVTIIYYAAVGIPPREETVTGTTFYYARSSSRYPWEEIRVAARNAAGIGPAVVTRAHDT